MKRLWKSVLGMVMSLSLLIGIVGAGFSASAESALKVGVGKGDITGPVTSISTGYNSLGDLMNGLLMRLNARAFTVAKDDKKVVYVSAELVHMTESIKPGVLEELKKRGLTDYTEENTMISATHCHSSTSNTSWYGLYDLVNGVPGYDEDNYKIIVKGIADAIEAADKDLAPGSVTLSFGETDIHSYNRSLDAKKWNVNYDASQYKSDLEAVEKTVDKEMSALFFAHDKGGDIGMIAFFPSHGTSNSIDNTLVASDHKGYAAYAVEQKMGRGYVAAFPQNESGDVSPNKPQDADYHLAFRRPADVDPTLDVLENEIVPGQEEADWAMKLKAGGPGITTIKLSPTVAYNYTTVDFSNIPVDKKYIGKWHMPYDDLDHARTSEPCIGAGIIAGDEEGAPVDNAKEGAVRHDFKLDANGNVVRTKVDFNEIHLSGLEKLFDPLWPTAMKILQSDKWDEEQMEKVVCLAVGHTGLMQPVTPLQIIQIGEVAIASCPFELNTEQGRRTKEVLTQTLAKAGVQKVILSTHTNAYSQYVTTREEYAAQHYEGATCLFGPWSGAALTQELDKLAQDLVAGKQTAKGPALRTDKTKLAIPTYISLEKPGVDSGNPGVKVEDVRQTPYHNGERVTATFQAANSRHIPILREQGRKDLVPDNYTYMAVQKQEGGKWVTIRTDADPYTFIQWNGNGVTKQKNATVGWLLRDVEPGTYRLIYNVVAKKASDSYKAFSVASSAFQVA